MSRAENCWDNTAMESFGALEFEFLSGKEFEDENAVRTELFEFIEVYYNRKRAHSSLGYRLPEEVHKGFAQNSTV